MSVPVDLTALEATATALGAEALLVTVGEDTTPHIVSTLVQWREGQVVTGAGRRTTANAAAHPSVTLLWPPVHDGAYRLIVDGDASVAADTVTVVPTFAVLHRIAGAEGDGPTCRPVEA